ncbi:MAG: PEGA domain-containing protein [bacterium]
MKKLLIFSFLIIVILSLSIEIKAVEVKTVAILEFENSIGRYYYETRGIEKTVQDRLYKLLTDSARFRVVEKDVISEIIEEQEFSLSGLVDESETAIELGKLIGADHIITGRLNTLSINEEKFSGYGTILYNVIAGMESNIRLISVTTGIIDMANSYKAEKEYQGKRSGSIDVRAASDELINEIVNKFEDDINNYNFFDSKTGEKLQVSFISNPSGASIELDGLYIGNTPLEIPVEPGVHSVKIFKGGYRVWKMNVKISQEMNKIDVNLGLAEN